MNETKEHILRTSLLLFLQKSYRDVTMREIVEKTGMSKGAFYHYFTSKEELFKEIVTRFMSSGAANYAAFNKTSLKKFYEDYIDSLDTSLKQLSNMVDEKERESFNFNFFLILFEAVGRFPEFLKMELQQHRKDINAWKKIIAVARKTGEIKSENTDEEIAQLFLFCSDGVFLRFINSDKPVTFPDFLRSAFNSIYKNLKT
ncbi:MAG TPA: helix-turn-helix domain-containing protein [Bacteroidales bacterium]|nr:helix-turn-helix domain-containing protein [Bacteroidales bacterium]